MIEDKEDLRRLYEDAYLLKKKKKRELHLDQSIYIGLKLACGLVYFHPEYIGAIAKDMVEKTLTEDSQQMLCISIDQWIDKVERMKSVAVKRLNRESSSMS